MQKTSLERITDESNLWSKANQTEETGNSFEAFLLYLKDASECLKQGSLVRAALSSSCAANSLASIGYPSEARRLYLETAWLYEENADSVSSESIRESLWCWEEAYGYYLLASDMDRAEKVFCKYARVIGRLNPFLGEEAIQSLRTKKGTGGTQITPSASVQLSKINKAIKDFLLSKGHAQISTNSMSDSSTITSSKSVKFVGRISKLYDDMINFRRPRKRRVKITEVIDNKKK